jgi:hypothetical protein
MIHKSINLATVTVVDAERGSVVPGILVTAPELLWLTPAGKALWECVAEIPERQAPEQALAIYSKGPLYQAGYRVMGFEISSFGESFGLVPGTLRVTEAQFGREGVFGRWLIPLYQLAMPMLQKADRCLGAATVSFVTLWKVELCPEEELVRWNLLGKLDLDAPELLRAVRKPAQWQ